MKPKLSMDLTDLINTDDFIHLINYIRQSRERVELELDVAGSILRNPEVEPVLKKKRLYDTYTDWLYQLHKLEGDYR